MKKKSIYIIFFISIIIFIGCINKHDKKLAEIRELEKTSLFTSDGLADSLHIIKLIDAYNGYSTSFPEDSLTPEFLFANSRLYIIINDFNSAIKTLDNIIEKYPSNNRIPDCIFLKANIYENYLHDFVNARKSYEILIDKYPNHNLSKESKILLENLGKSPEELLQSILAKRTNQNS